METRVPGEMNLQKLLATMKPELHDDVYVFASTTDEGLAKRLRARLRFEEAEGTTLIITREEAEATGLTYAFPCRMITLTVHSALDAVGFIAAIASHLAKAGMGVNPVSAFYHDHLFVPAERAEEALELLRTLSVSSGGR